MKHKLFNFVLTAIIAVTLMLSVFGTAPVAAQTPVPTQETCDAIVAKFKNVAQWDDTTWQACFAAGMLNAVIDPEHPLPEKFGPAIMDAFEKGFYLQLDSPHGDGCDNTLAHPKCSIGFLKLFSSRERLVAFIAKGEFEQAGVLKKGPWTEYSLWMARDFTQVATGEKMSAEDAKLFCTGALVLAFAYDGEFPLPEKSPCGDAKLTYSIGERWNGGCDGNALNEKCNVGERIEVSSWKQVTSSTIGSGWNRGSVRVVVQSALLLPSATQAQATAITPVKTSTPVPAGTSAAGTPTALPTQTATPGTVGTPTEAVVTDVEPTDAVATLPQRPSGAYVVLRNVAIVLSIILFAGIVALIWLAVANSRKNAAAQQPAENAGGEAAAQQPAENAGGDALEHPALRVRRPRGE